jgi:hypothetical protein
MNERIDELWQEAVDTTWTDNSKSAHEKFAELIVRECALQCQHNDDMDLIEKHFGVDI